MNSSSDLLLASLTAILESGFHRHSHLNRISASRSIEKVEANTYGLPEGQRIAKELRRWFRKQKKAVLNSFPTLWPLPMHFPDFTHREWMEPMVKEIISVLTPIWNSAYRQLMSMLSIGQTTDAVVNPFIRHQIERQSFHFCQSTNQTTTQRLDKALESLRHEFVTGVVDQGDAIPELTSRVKAIFTGLTESHATTIARTEASRAHHAAQELAAIESGVVAGKEWLISDDACELCKKVATESKRVRLGQAFAVVGSDPHYSTILYPPLHPNCRCSVIDVLMPEYGGPADVEWAQTLYQPQKDLDEDYEPPEGKEVPEPEPERLKNRFRT